MDDMEHSSSWKSNWYFIREFCCGHEKGRERERERESACTGFSLISHLSGNCAFINLAPAIPGDTRRYHNLIGSPVSFWHFGILVVGTYPLSKGASQAKTQAKTQAILSIPIEWKLTWKVAWLLDWTQAKTEVVFQAKILANWIAATHVIVPRFCRAKVERICGFWTSFF